MVVFGQELDPPSGRSFLDGSRAGGGAYLSTLSVGPRTVSSLLNRGGRGSAEVGGWLGYRAFGRFFGKVLLGK